EVLPPTRVAAAKEFGRDFEFDRRSDSEQTGEIRGADALPCNVEQGAVESESAGGSIAGGLEAFGDPGGRKPRAPGDLRDEVTGRIVFRQDEAPARHVRPLRRSESRRHWLASQLPD